MCIIKVVRLLISFINSVSSDLKCEIIKGLAKILFRKGKFMKGQYIVNEALEEYLSYLKIII